MLSLMHFWPTLLGLIDLHKYPQKTALLYAFKAAYGAVEIGTLRQMWLSVTKRKNSCLGVLRFLPRGA